MSGDPIWDSLRTIRCQVFTSCVLAASESWCRGCDWSSGTRRWWRPCTSPGATQSPPVIIVDEWCRKWSRHKVELVKFRGKTEKMHSKSMSLSDSYLICLFKTPLRASLCKYYSSHCWPWVGGINPLYTHFTPNTIYITHYFTHYIAHYTLHMFRVRRHAEAAGASVCVRVWPAGGCGHHPVPADRGGLLSCYPNMFNVLLYLTKYYERCLLKSYQSFISLNKNL